MNTSTQPRTTDGRYTFKAAGAPVGTLADPWGEAAPPQPVVDPMEELRGLCDEVGHALATKQGLDELYAATGTSSPHELVSHVGQQVLDQAYERAGITPQQVQQRVQAALKEQEEHEKAAAKLLEENELLSPAIFNRLSERQKQQVREVAAPPIAHELAQAELARERSKCKQELGELSRAYRETLEEIRPIGGELSFTVGGTKAAQQAFNEAASFYPAEWVQASNDERYPLMPRINKQRSHYVHSRLKRKTSRALVSGAEFASFEQAQDYAKSFDGRYRVARPGEPGLPDDGLYHLVAQEEKILIPGINDTTPPKGPGWRKEYVGEHQDGRPIMRWKRDQAFTQIDEHQVVSEITTEHRTTMHLDGQKDTTATAIHEMAHRFECVVPGILGLEEQHIASRRTSEQTRPLSGPVSAFGRARASREIIYDGDWTISYMGKTYGGQAWEMLSCSSEALFGGSYGGLVGAGSFKADPKSAAFAMGVLACVKAPGQKRV